MEIVTAKISAIVTEIHIPFTPKICGSIKTAEVSKIIKCKNEIIDDVIPSFNAVKNAEIHGGNSRVFNSFGDYVDNSGSNATIYSYALDDEIINRAGGSNSFIDTGNGNDKVTNHGQNTTIYSGYGNILLPLTVTAHKSHSARITTTLMLMLTMLSSRHQEAIRPFNQTQECKRQETQYNWRQEDLFNEWWWRLSDNS